MAEIDPKGKEKNILDAAVQEFAFKGFHGCNVASIAKVARVSVGTIYRIFGSKEDLANRTLQRSLARYNEFRTDHLDRDVPPRRQFTSIIDPIIGLYSKYPEDFVFAEVQFTGSFIDSVSIAVRRDLYSRLLNWAEAMKAKGVLINVPTELIIAMVRGAFIDLIKASQDKDRKVTKKAFKQLEDLCWESISRSCQPEN